MLNDLRLALRTLRRRPGYSLVIVTTFAVGLGAAIALFALVDAILIRPLPFEASERLIYGFGSFPLNDSASVSPPDFLDYRRRSASFEELGAHYRFPSTVDITGGNLPESIRAARVSRNYFDVLGVRPLLGHSFPRTEDEAPSDQVALLSHGFWQRRFGGDPAIVGSAVRLQGEEHVVLGVLPAGFELLEKPEVFLPIPFGQPETSVRRFHFLGAVGRLRPGVDLAAAQQEFDAIALDLAETYPASNEGWRMRLVPLKEVVAGDVRRPLLLLLAAVGLVLLVVCANVGSLSLARGATRQGELALRRTLGAGRGALVRMLLAENLALAVAGGIGGLLLAAFTVDAVAALAPDFLPRAREAGIDGRILAFAGWLSLATGLLSALAPTFALGKTTLRARLAGGRTVSPASSHLRDALVVAQVALSVVLLAFSALLIRSLQELDRAELGFEPGPLLTAAVTLPEGRYPDSDARLRFYDALTAEAGALPGIEAVALADLLPFTGSNDTFLYPEGQPPEAPSPGFNTEVRRVGEGYFSTLGAPLLAGRALTPADHAEAPPVAVINEALASMLFRQGQPPAAIGQRLVVDVGEALTVTVVGIAPDLQQHQPGVPDAPTLYLAQRQRPESSARLLVRTTGEPAAAVSGLRDLLQNLDPELPLAEVVTLDERLNALHAAPRFRTSLLSAFGLVALALAAFGIYGILAHQVTERRRELGLRQALGAVPAALARLVVGRGMGLTALGLVLGVPAALGSARLLRSLLFEIQPGDPASLLAAAGVVAATALLACLLPALRAARVDPMAALRLD